MTLLPGTRLGPYEIVAPLGSGGMGEVYRARDSRLARDVAVKSLPASATGDAERVARFRREAQILAGLNHPHIAALYGLEEAHESQFLVMELVEGGTLADRLARGPLALRDAFSIGRQIADALQAAHDRGIIHRDLKPANIAFTADGHAKVLDFGLAKAFTADSDVPTIAAAATQSGVVLGTAAYMSPEQARGLPLDKRTDIFSFGGVLYEMLTARHPFGGDTVSDIIVAILGREPDWTLLPADTPARVRWLLRRCLEKDPRRRLHDIADARIELEEALANPADSGAMTTAMVTGASARPIARELVAWTLAGVSLVALTAILTLRGRPQADTADAAVYNALIPLPALARTPEQVTRFALSPDGRKIAFVGTGPAGSVMLWVRPLDSAVAQPIAGTEGGNYPFWSADSRHVGFIWRPSQDVSAVNSRLKKVTAGGGEAATLANVSLPGLCAWNRDGVILFTPAGNAPLYLVRDSGGASSEATTLDVSRGHVQHAQPFFLPDGRHFLYTAIGSRTAGATAASGIYLGTLGEPRTTRLLMESASHASYANGHILFLRGPSLMAQPFDPDRLELAGSPLPVVERVVAAPGGLAAGYSVSGAGVLAFEAPSPVRSQLAWFDRGGKELAPLGDRADWVDVALSPDGLRAASSMTDATIGTRDIWVFDVKRGLAERFTGTPADDFAPVWSPGGDRLVFSSVREGRVDLFQKAHATDYEQRIPDNDLPLGKFAASWSPDRRAVLFIAGGGTIARSDLMLLPVAGGAPETFLDSSVIETQARFSPDGRWIAYASNPSGRLEVYVKPYGRPGEARRISGAGGRWPQWRRDMSELVFLSPDDTLMSASLRVTPEDVAVEGIRPLFTVKLRSRVRLDAYPYDMTGDGQRFLVNTFVEEPGASSGLTLLVNWAATLKK